MAKQPRLDYFSTGARPLLLQFPPCVSRCHKSVLWLHDEEGFFERGSSHTTAGDSSSLASTQKTLSSGASVKAKAVKAPCELHTSFDPESIQQWDSTRFQDVQMMQKAARNHGQVHRMQDFEEGKSVAVKVMPNKWICESAAEFAKTHPFETEQPWTDIGCLSFLNSVNFRYCCELLGVYRGEENTSVVTELASEGDLFSWSGVPSTHPPGPAREAMLLPLAKQILDSVRQLHEMSLVHRDLSLENIVLTKVPEENGHRVKVIDFGMTATGRHYHRCVRGKASYQAPEVHEENAYDAFLTDAFALGVTFYAALMKDYPWLSTKPGGCKCFEFVKKNGFRAFVNKRKLRGHSGTVASFMSEELIELLEGLLAFDPNKRLTLGESCWSESGRRSVWDEPWVQKSLS